jgi:hypothetical protein
MVQPSGDRFHDEDHLAENASTLDPQTPNASVQDRVVLMMPRVKRGHAGLLFGRRRRFTPEIGFRSWSSRYRGE